MVFKFFITSEDVENFKREIQIDRDDTFHDLHKIILECCNYDEDEMMSFFICDDWWKRKQEIALVEKDTDSDVDSYVMKEEVLSDWFEEEDQKLIFVFDNLSDRAFFMELVEMIPGESLSEAACTKKRGSAPPQFIEEEPTAPVKPAKTTPVKPPIDDEESFYGDADYNPDELDMDGFEGVEGADTDLGISDDIV